MARYSKTLWDTNTIYNPTNMNHIEQGIYDADLREGGEINGDLYIIKKGTTSAIGESIVSVGNNIAEGTDKNSRGRLRLYSNSTKYIEVLPSNDMAGNLSVRLPIPSTSNKVLALREDMHTVLARITPNSNETVAQIIQRLRSTYWGDWATDIKKYGIIGMTIDGLSSLFFRCYRFANNSNANYVCVFPSSTTINIYVLNFGSSNVTAVRKWSISATGTTYSDLSTSLADGDLVFQSIND